MRRILAVASVFVLFACGKGQSVGDEKLLEFEEQQNARRLGEATAAPPPVSAAPLAVNAPTPRPTAAPIATPAARFFDVSLVSDSPFYEPGNALVMVVGVTLRVTNKDTTPERTQRSFHAEDASFDSGPLRPGQSWQERFDRPGRWRIKDVGLPFASATLEVRAT